MRPSLGLKGEEWSEIPQQEGWDVRLVDSHLHLSDYPDPLGLVRAAVSTEMTFLACSVDKESSMRTLALQKSHGETIKAFIGVHPSEASKVDDMNWFDSILTESDGVGEIGLDPKYDGGGGEGSQMEVFLRQLRAAERLGKPVQVHTRGAEKETLGTLESFHLDHVLLHWFQGENQLGEAMAKRYFVSFGPALLTSDKLRRMAKRCDHDLVLTETDGPVSFASLGGTSGPTLIPSVVFALAELWGMTFESCMTKIVENNNSYLGELTKG